MNLETPLVTCLCLTTAGRADFLKRAIDCFWKQTYERKELLIVADSCDDVPEVPWSMAEPSIVSVMVTSGNIGTKRNRGCESAGGEIIALWDDDDFSAPGRLSFQVQSLKIARKAVIGFQVMKFTDGASWWQYSAAPGFVVGSSLCFRRDWWAARYTHPKYPGIELQPHSFPDVQIGEDAVFCSNANLAGELAMCPDVDLMYATIHSGNTSVRDTAPEKGWVKLDGFKWKV